MSPPFRVVLPAALASRNDRVARRSAARHPSKPSTGLVPMPRRRTLLSLLICLAAATAPATAQNVTDVCDVCVCWARTTCAGDKDHWVYSSVNKNCKTGIIDCRDSELTDLSLIPILNGTVDVTEMDSITGDTYTQNYPIARVMLSGNMFPAVPDDYFANVSDTLEIVHLHANPSLTTLPAGLFSGMPHLHTVVAHHSGIDSIPASLFKDSPSLATVWMHSNAITTVAADAFTGVGASLTALWLHINEIAIVEPGTLSGLTGLTELYLHHNFLKEDEFTCALLCDVPTDSDVKAFQNVTDKLFCGTACDVTDGQIGAWVDNKVCGYDMCVSWGLSGARRVDGGLLGLAGAAVLGLGAALVL